MRFVRDFFISALITCVPYFCVPTTAQQLTPPDKSKLPTLKVELSTVREELKQADQDNATYAGGLIKSLIGVRVATLKNTEAMLEQKIYALENGASFKYVLSSEKPDGERSAHLEAEIQRQKAALKNTEDEAAKYSGGLILAELLSTAATIRNTIAMLEQQKLAAEYGFPLYASQEPAVPNPTAVLPVAPHGTVHSSEADRATSLILIEVMNKRYDSSDFQNFVWFDTTYNPVGIIKPARAVKGTIEFADLFGEVKFRLNSTINQTLTPGSDYTEKGVGFSYNEFMDSHIWMRNTAIQDMKITFRVHSIIYVDGTSEELDR